MLHYYVNRNSYLPQRQPRKLHKGLTINLSSSFVIKQVKEPKISLKDTFNLADKL